MYSGGNPMHAGRNPIAQVLDKLITLLIGRLDVDNRLARGQLLVL